MQLPTDHGCGEIPASAAESPGIWRRWHNWPLYLRIVGAVALGVLVGLVLGERAGVLQLPSRLVLRVLGALAPPLVLVAIVQALMRAEIGGRQAGRLVRLLVLNTLVAISIGLLVANVVQPGRWVKARPVTEEKHAAQAADPLSQFLDNVPKSIMGPLSDGGSVLSVIFLAVSFGIALRQLRHHQLNTMDDVVHIALTSLVIILGWVIDVIPLAVFGIVASIIGTQGFADFVALGGFVFAVVIALLLQATYYLVRIHYGSWVRPRDLLRGTRDALVMAFSTSSSTATMPVTYACLRNNVGVREESATMGALVGANFNNDGTALYEAMSALFIAQLIGQQLTVGQQLLVVITSVVASVGAAGIPEAGLVTMTMVFKAVGLPVEYIAMLITVDWFLDRSRTAINVMGDLNVSCLLDGKTPPTVAHASELDAIKAALDTAADPSA